MTTCTTANGSGVDTIKMGDACIGEVILTEEAIALRVKALGAELSELYRTLNPILIVVLKGSYIFGADISRNLKVPHEVEFIRCQSYSGTASTGSVKMVTGLSKNLDLTGRHVLIVEDIVDTGLTLQKISEEFKGKGVASIKTCTFVQKATKRRLENVPSIDYVAFELPDLFIVGYGLDIDQKLRHLPYVAVYRPEKGAAAESGTT